MKNIGVIIFFLISINFKLYAIDTGNSKIIFKINEKVFTNIDLERRIKYLEIINKFDSSSLSNSEMNEIFDDYISALIFNEYYILNEIDFKISQKEIDIFYENNIVDVFTNNNFNKEEIIYIKYNIYIDLVRKRIIEKSLNSKRNILLEEADSLDLLYDYNFSYLIINKNDIDKLEINNINNRNDFTEFKILLSKNKINYFHKNETVNNNTVLSSLLKNIIKNNQKIYFDKKNDFITIISFEKNLESYEGIFVKLVSFNSDIKLKKNDLNCNNINKNIKNNKTIYKEYEYTKLNNEIKNNLKSINDFIVFTNENNFNYIFLCELRYDKELLNNINFNKKVNFLAKKIQLNFIRKYKNEYNFQKIQ